MRPAEKRTSNHRRIPWTAFRSRAGHRLMIEGWPSNDGRRKETMATTRYIHIAAMARVERVPSPFGEAA